MHSCCRTCNHRSHALAQPSAPSVLDVTLITLKFTSPINASNSTPYIALNIVLNNITDSADHTTHPTRFTSWSPTLDDPSTVIVLTTASETCNSSTAPIFSPLTPHLKTVPSVLHVFLDYAIINLNASNLNASSSAPKIAAEFFIINAPNASVAGAIGKRFGWEPKKVSLSAYMEKHAGGGLHRPGDLIRDFWAWAEIHDNESMTPSSTMTTSDGEPVMLRSTNSDEKNMGFYEYEDVKKDVDDETLVMLFQWKSLPEAERFKHPLRATCGFDDVALSNDLWDRHVAHPMRQLEGIGARVDNYTVELRGVEQRIDTGKTRERSSSRRLSTLTTGLGERVTGLWR